MHVEKLSSLPFFSDAFIQIFETKSMMRPFILYFLFILILNQNPPTGDQQLNHILAHHRSGRCYVPRGLFIFPVWTVSHPWWWRSVYVVPSSGERNISQMLYYCFPSFTDTVLNLSRLCWHWKKTMCPIYILLPLQWIKTKE